MVTVSLFRRRDSGQVYDYISLSMIIRDKKNNHQSILLCIYSTNYLRSYLYITYIHSDYLLKRICFMMILLNVQYFLKCGGRSFIAFISTPGHSSTFFNNSSNAVSCVRFGVVKVGNKSSNWEYSTLSNRHTNDFY